MSLCRFPKGQVNAHRLGLILRPLRLITSASVSSFAGDLPNSLVAASAATTGAADVFATTLTDSLLDAASTM